MTECILSPEFLAEHAAPEVPLEEKDLWGLGFKRFCGFLAAR